MDPLNRPLDTGGACILLLIVTWVVMSHLEEDQERTEKVFLFFATSCGNIFGIAVASINLTSNYIWWVLLALQTITTVGLIEFYMSSIKKYESSTDHEENYQPNQKQIILQKERRS